MITHISESWQYEGDVITNKEKGQIKVRKRRPGEDELDCVVDELDLHEPIVSNPGLMHLHVVQTWRTSIRMGFCPDVQIL
jgi:hypothetical protein